MSKYIDKDRVLEYIIFGVVGKDITCGELTRAIESIPTIDIVRCKECKYHKTRRGDDLIFCDAHCDTEMPFRVEPDGFCNLGARK